MIKPNIQAALLETELFLGMDILPGRQLILPHKVSVSNLTDMTFDDDGVTITVSSKHIKNYWQYNQK